jgi:hypothetical protein
MKLAIGRLPVESGMRFPQRFGSTALLEKNVCEVVAGRGVVRVALEHLAIEPCRARWLPGRVLAERREE